MSELNLSTLFTILTEYASSMNLNQIYSELFFSYYENDDTGRVEEYTASKIKKGSRTLDRNGIQYYLKPENHGKLLDDIYDRILPYISDKFGMCMEISELIQADSMNENDKRLLLEKYPEDEEDIASFLADVVIFSLARPKKGKRKSPVISERISIPAISSCKYFCGREKELQAFSEMLEAHDKVFIYGIGGVGKSEFIKKYARDFKKEYTNILFITHEGDLKNTIANISFKDDKQDDTLDIRFKNHREYLRRMENDSLIIIDNFDIRPEDDDYLETLLTYNCKIVFTTRNHFGEDYNIFELTEMGTDELMLIAKAMKISENADMLYRLFSAVHNHTLACELILKLLDKHAYTGEDILTRLTDSSIAPDISDKIRRKGKGTAKYSEHIQKLFDLFTLSIEQQNTLRFLSLVPAYGIGDIYFKRLAGLDDFNTVNELDEIGLIYHSSGTISVHPLIAEISVLKLKPDMNNCRIFLDNIICEARNMMDDPSNRVRRLVLLPIADNVISYCDKSGSEKYYIHFINSLCTYAEVFYDTAHMRSFITEVDRYIERDYPAELHAVHFMSKAALAKINKSNSDAISFTLKAAEFINENDVILAINIYNNLFRFYMDSDDMENAEKYCRKTEQLISNFPRSDNSTLLFLFNICDFYMKQQNYRSARESIKVILRIIEQTAPNSHEHIEALMRASEIYHALGDEITSTGYSDLARMLAGRKLLNGDV